MEAPAITFAANLTADPDLRYTPNGKPVAGMRVATSPRHYDAASNTWRTGETTYLDVEVWGDPAANVSDSLRKGDRVLVSGRIRTDVYTPDSGPNAGTEQRRLRVVADEVALSLRFTGAKVVKTQRSTSEPEPATGAAS